MTNLTSPVASATSGLPENNMADVIDSLKRLERLGDENSKTVQKILDAAREIEARIVKLYDQYPDGVTIQAKKFFNSGPPYDFDIGEDAQLKSARSAFEDEAKALGISPDLYNVSYSIESREGVRCLIYDRGAYQNNERVSENRDAALKFADHIAKGLLVAITKHLESQKGDNEQALGVLFKAKEALGKKI